MVVKEAVRCAAEQMWLGDKGMRDAMSITEPPIGNSPRSEVVDAEEDTLGNKSVDDAFNGHQIRVCHPTDADECVVYGCVRCRAYATRRFAWTCRVCTLARTPSGGDREMR